jgi:hypothetical protein
MSDKPPGPRGWPTPPRETAKMAEGFRLAVRVRGPDAVEFVLTDTDNRTVINTTAQGALGLGQQALAAGLLALGDAVAAEAIMESLGEILNQDGL